MEQKLSVSKRPRKDFKLRACGLSGGGCPWVWALAMWLALAILASGMASAQGSPAVDTPAISPAGGNYLLKIAVSINCPMAGATIHYTLNGAAPTEADPVYTAPFNLTPPVDNNPVQITARAFQAGYSPSAPVSETYSFVVPMTVYVAAAAAVGNPTGPWTGGVDYPLPTIQSAIDAAVEGTEIVVQAGIYQENINFKNKNIRLRSENASYPYRDLESTVIDGGGVDATVTFGGKESGNCSLRGFLITNGNGLAGGINGNGTRAAIEYNVIRDNMARAFLTSSTQATHQELRWLRLPNGTDWTSVTIAIHETINHYVATGGAASACNGVIQNNLIINNQCAGPAAVAQAPQKSLLDGASYTPQDESITTAQYHNGGSALDHCGGMIANNTIWNNGPDGVPALAGCAGQIRNNIIWANGAGPQLDELCAPPQYCCIQGWSGPGTGNVTADPLFVNPAKSDFTLQPDSPCLDAGGAVTLMYRDLRYLGRPMWGWTYARGDGSRIDIGAFENQGNRSQLPAPSINPVSGSYPSPVTITMDPSGSSFGTQIRYTLNGRDPIENETVYAAGESVYASSYYDAPALLLSGAEGTSVTIKARVYFSYGLSGWSPVSSRSYFFRKTQTFYVDAANTLGPWTGSADQPFKTIRSALDVAGSGDKILVSQGTYKENIKFHNQNVVLSSLDPKRLSCVTATVIDGGAKGSVVEFGGKETPDCLLTGFTITNGLAVQGGGILGNGTQATIDNNRIVKNKASQRYEYSQTGQEIVDSVAYVRRYVRLSGYGGGFYGCNGAITNNLIADNVAGEPSLPSRGVQDGTNIYYTSVDSDFEGAALHNCYGGIANNTICRNVCYPNANGMFGSIMRYCEGALTNLIVWDNTAQYMLVECATPNFCDIQGGVWTSGLGNLSATPLFINPDEGDFHLEAASPCIDTGCRVSAALDFEGRQRGIITVGGRPGDGSHFDMGAFECSVVKIQTPKPVIQTAPGTYVSSLTVTITCPLAGAAISYLVFDKIAGQTLPHTMPYTGPFQLTGKPGQTLDVVAWASMKNTQYVDSEQVTATYAIVGPAIPVPVINPPSGTYPAPIRISMSDLQAGVTIRYTLNGNDPTGTETIYGATPTETTYSAPFTIAGTPGMTVTLKARASETGYLASPVALRTYTFAAPRRIFVDDDARAGGDGGWQAPYRKIQDALDNANSGDTIFVAPGTYRENIEFRNKNVVLQSRDPRSWSTILKTVIDGGAKGPVVRFGGSETNFCILTGFTITNGQHPYGGGIAGENTGATIERNYIVNNTAYGVTAEWEQTRAVQGNPPNTTTYIDHYRTLTGLGGGIANTQGWIENNVIAYNHAGVAAAAKPTGSTALVVTSYHDDTLYQGSALYHCQGPICNNTVWGNSGGSSVVQSCWSYWNYFRNNIVWANFPSAYVGSTAPANCDIQDWKGAGSANLNADPRLLDPAHDDFHLRLGSPCIDAGSASSGDPIDLEGIARGYIGTSGVKSQRFDIGAFECVIAPPEMTPDGGAALTLPLTVPVRCATPGATIRYTLDGSDPTAFSPLYTAPLALKGAPGATLTLKARAFKAGLPDSPVTARTFGFAPLAITQVSRTGVVADTLAASKLVYVGRSLRFADPIPASLKGQWYLRTLYTDKDSNAALSFTVNQPVTVVVALSAKLAPLPGWLNGWTKMNETLTTNDTVPLRVLYKKSFAAGRITLGANREGATSTGQNPYSVIVTP